MTTSTLAHTAPAAAPIMPAELKQIVRDTVFPDSTDAELALFAHDCARQGVHPLDRLIHPQVRMSKGKRRYVAVTSIDLMRSRAADTGEHAGTDDATYGPCRDSSGVVVEDGAVGAVPEYARVTVYRLVNNQRVPFTATARWLEYVPEAPSDQMWRKMPFLMLAKCAEALALRKAFPRQLSGMYEQAEMAQAGPTVEAQAEAVEVRTSPPKAPRAVARPATAATPTPDKQAIIKQILRGAQEAGLPFKATADAMGKGSAKGWGEWTVTELEECWRRMQPPASAPEPVDDDGADFSAPLVNE